MSFENSNITYLQKVAIKGEVATILMHALTKADIDYCVYYILKESDEKYRYLFFEAIKDALDTDEDLLNSILFKVNHKIVPVDIWINKILSDIYLNLKAPEITPYMEALPFKRTQEKKNILISSFIMFVREVIMTCPPVAVDLLNAVLNEQNLEFIHPACLYLFEGCKEIQNFECCSNEISEEIFRLKFNPRAIMSIDIETRSILLDKEKAHKYPSEETKAPNIITIEGSISNEQLSQAINQKVLELINSLSNENNQTSYVVQKEFKNTNIRTDVAQCKTEKEALKFIEQVKKENPELQRTCNFIIKREQ